MTGETTKRVEHDPTPWEIRDFRINNNGKKYSTRDLGYVAIYAANDEDVVLEFDVSVPEGDADAKFIIRACNSHTELAVALEALMSYTISCERVLNASEAGQIEQARTALANARATE
jgi:hypothetical protein